MIYVYDYRTLVNREDNIRKELITNPLQYYNITNRVIHPKEINSLDIKEEPKMVVNLIMNGFFMNEKLNNFSKYIVNSSILNLDVLDKIIVISRGYHETISKHQSENLSKYVKHHKVKIIETTEIKTSKILENIQWNCYVTRSVQDIIEILRSKIDISGKEFICDGKRQLDAVNNILLIEKGAKITYKEMN